MKKNILDDLTDVFNIYVFVRYTIPFLFLFIVIIFFINLIYENVMDKKYKNMKNVIVTSKLTDKVCNYSRNLYDKNVFSNLICGDKYHSVDIEYYFNDETKTAEEYDLLVKEEIKKLYEKIKNKSIKKDEIFAETDNIIINLSFAFPRENNRSSYICSFKIYYNEKGIDEEFYQENINKVIVNEEILNNAKNRVINF